MIQMTGRATMLNSIQYKSVATLFPTLTLKLWRARADPERSDQMHGRGKPRWASLSSSEGGRRHTCIGHFPRFVTPSETSLVRLKFRPLGWRPEEYEVTRRTAALGRPSSHAHSTAFAWTNGKAIPEAKSTEK